MDARVYETSYTIHHALDHGRAISLLNPSYARYRMGEFVQHVYGDRYVQTADLMYRGDSDTYLLAAKVEIGC